MLRVYFLQQGYVLSDAALEDAPHDQRGHGEPSSAGTACLLPPPCSAFATGSKRTGPAPEQMLETIRRLQAGHLGELPAVFALRRAEQALQVRPGTGPRRRVGEVTAQAGGGLLQGGAQLALLLLELLCPHGLDQITTQTKLQL